ncbi:MAG: hypothetical protein IE928_04975 [Gammaproteobacteria bacterium]|nr:hypothetical protein [Gammaproteobacteria bacterium]
MTAIFRYSVRLAPSHVNWRCNRFANTPAHGSCVGGIGLLSLSLWQKG